METSGNNASMTNEEIEYFKLLDQCADNCKQPYCFFKMLVEQKHSNPRFLTQSKCVEILKWNKSAEAHDDIGWGKAGQLWIDEGYAEAFAIVYKPELTVKEVYTKTEELQKKMAYEKFVEKNPEKNIDNSKML